MDLELKGSSFVVTGGSRGIGRALVEKLLAEGAFITFCARDQKKIDEVIKQFDGSSNLQGISGDVLTKGFCKNLVECAFKRFGRIDGLVANVGGGRGVDDPKRYSWDDWQYSIDLNVRHSLELTMSGLQYLASSRGASVVFVSSISGGRFGPAIQYSASKAMLSHIAQTLGRLLAPNNIRVNSISPGSILGEENHWYRFQQRDPGEFHHFLQDSFPRGRMGTEVEVADIITFLLSPRSSLISGANIAADGGQDHPTNQKW